MRAATNRWTKNTVWSQALEDGDVRDVTYCLRLLDAEEALEINKVPILVDMMRRLRRYPSNVLTIRQAKYAAGLIKKANLHESLALKFNMMEAKGEEIGLGDLGNDAESSIDEEPERELEPVDSFYATNSRWGNVLMTVDEIIAAGDVGIARAIALILTDEELLRAYHKTDQDRTQGMARVFWNEFYERISEMIPVKRAVRVANRAARVAQIEEWEKNGYPDDAL